jgi:hypothetical protein
MPLEQLHGRFVVRFSQPRLIGDVGAVVSTKEVEQHPSAAGIRWTAIQKSPVLTVAKAAAKHSQKRSRVILLYRTDSIFEEGILFLDLLRLKAIRV